MLTGGGKPLPLLRIVYGNVLCAAHSPGILGRTNRAGSAALTQ
jgi:hypothetical protein